MSNDTSNASTNQSKAEDRIKPTDIPREIRATVAEKRPMYIRPRATARTAIRGR